MVQDTYSNGYVSYPIHPLDEMALSRDLPPGFLPRVRFHPDHSDYRLFGENAELQWPPEARLVSNAAMEAVSRHLWQIQAKNGLMGIPANPEVLTDGDDDEVNVEDGATATSASVDSVATIVEANVGNDSSMVNWVGEMAERLKSIRLAIDAMPGEDEIPVTAVVDPLVTSQVTALVEMPIAQPVLTDAAKDIQSTMLAMRLHARTGGNYAAQNLRQHARVPWTSIGNRPRARIPGMDTAQFVASFLTSSNATLETDTNNHRSGSTSGSMEQP